MARVLLLNPFIYDITAFDSWAKPKGLLEVGRLFVDLGLDVDFIDCLDRGDAGMARWASDKQSFEIPVDKPFGTGTYYRRQQPTPSGLLGLKRRFYRYGFAPDYLRHCLATLTTPPDLIGVTGIMTYWCRGVRETIAIARELFPRVPVVLGGIYPTLLPDHAEAQAGADLLHTGPATAASLARLLDEFKIPHAGVQQAAQAQTKGFWGYYPYPHPRYGVVNTSTGCHKACTYCASRRLVPHFTGFQPAVVLRELTFLASCGVEDVAFYDDALLHEKENRLFPLLAETRRSLPRLRFHTPNGMHLDLVDEQTAHLLKTSNFQTLRFGFETANAELNRRTGEKVDLDRFQETIVMLRGEEFTNDQIGVYVMAGLPGQDPAMVAESIRFVKASGARPVITEFSPIPGTAEFDRALAASPVDFAADPELQNNSLLPLRNRAFPEEVLNRLKILCYTSHGHKLQIP